MCYPLHIFSFVCWNTFRYFIWAGGNMNGYMSQSCVHTDKGHSIHLNLPAVFPGFIKSEYSVLFPVCSKSCVLDSSLEWSENLKVNKRSNDFSSFLFCLSLISPKILFLLSFSVFFFFFLLYSCHYSGVTQLSVKILKFG